ncbi:hypothetical protein D3C80_1236430 [compost metagenome]
MVQGGAAILDTEAVSIGLDDSRRPRLAGPLLHVPPVIGQRAKIDGQPQRCVLESVGFCFGESLFEVVCHAMRPVDGNCRNPSTFVQDGKDGML